jgi:hypothetical protein
MSVNALENVLARPEHPHEVPSIGDWASVERELKTKLPEDYKWFIEAFGSGTIDDFLIIFNPFSSNANVNLLQSGQAELKAYAVSKKQFPELYVHGIYPEPHGILPFGATDNGEVIFWKTTGRPHDWSVVAYESRGPKYFEFAGNCTDFLAAVLRRTIRCDVFPEDFPSITPSFTPISAGANT